MSKETFYFSHDYNARNDIKIQALLVEHGAAGYGVYWVIVEILHEEASTSVEQVKAIVKCCLEYGLFTEDDGCFFSKRVLGNINKRLDISEKRAKAGRMSAKKRKKATSVEQNPTNANKEKERKEKERKENTNTNTKRVFDFKKSLLAYGFEKELVDEWMIIRNKKKAVNSEFAYNSFILQVERAGAEKNELLRIIAEKQWAGFNHEWMRNINNNLNGIENETDRRARESAKHKQELYDYARSVGMVGGEEKQDTAEIW